MSHERKCFIEEGEKKIGRFSKNMFFFWNRPKNAFFMDSNLSRAEIKKLFILCGSRSEFPIERNKI